MKVPKDLIIIDEDGTVYKPNYESLKSSIQIQDIDGTKWNDLIYRAYRELLFAYQIRETVQELDKQGMEYNTNILEIDYWSMYNSLNFWRSKVTRTLGNGAITKAQAEVGYRWKKIEEAPKESK